MDLNNAKDAEKYIKQHHKSDNVDLGLNIQDGMIQVDSRKRTTVNHVATANTIIKFINITPGLHPMSRKIMTMRIANPGIKFGTIGLACGLRDYEVRQYEKDGIHRVKNYMETYSVQDGINKFNTQATVEQAVKNEMKLKNNPLLAKEI